MTRALFALRVDSPALAAVVTSYISWWLLKHLATRLQNGYIQIFVNQIERLPIPVLDSRHGELRCLLALRS